MRKWADFCGIKGKVTDPKTVMRYDYERDNLGRNLVNSLNYEEE